MEENISFSKLVKEELVNNEYESIDRLKALLSSYIRINGSIVFRNKETILTLKSENAKTAKFIYEKLVEVFKVKAEINFLNKGNTKRTVYSILIKDNSDEVVEDLEISFLEGKISKNIVKNDDTISGYLAGAFLASGSINSPKTSNYHLEICVNNENYAKWLSKLFGKYRNSNIEPKITSRRDKYIVYFKKSDQIADFLVMIGAVSSCMEFETIRVDRDFNNSANRLTNSDTANLKKILDTSKKQIEEIDIIDSKFGIKNIPNEKERELCFLRKENEAASMKDLAILLGDKLNTNVSKSNINHLFRSIHERYLKLCK